MSILKSFQDCTVMLNDLANAAVNARFGVVERVLTVLEGPMVTDIQSKNMVWLYEYYDVYLDPSATMEIGEPSGPSFADAGADAGVSPEEYAAWFS
jgi:hypothetical protein